MKKVLFACILTWFCQKLPSRVTPAKARSIVPAGKHLSSSGDWYSQVCVLLRALPCWCGSAQCFLSDNMNSSRTGHNVTFPLCLRISSWQIQFDLHDRMCGFRSQCSKVPIFPLTSNMSCRTEFINVAYTLKVEQTLKQILKHWDESRLYGSAWT